MKVNSVSMGLNAVSFGKISVSYKNKETMPTLSPLVLNEYPHLKWIAAIQDPQQGHLKLTQPASAPNSLTMRLEHQGKLLKEETLYRRSTAATLFTLGMGGLMGLDAWKTHILTKANELTGEYKSQMTHANLRTQPPAEE